jgi:uncharacterized membrane protein YhaH (DUF805 family)
VSWSYLLFSFEGRISRRPFWIALLILLALEAAANLVADTLEGERLSAITDLALTYPEFALFAKRGQDRDLSPLLTGVFFLSGVVMDFLIVMGWRSVMDRPFFLAFAVPWMVIALALAVELGFRPGMTGANRFGPDPLDQA